MKRVLIANDEPVLHVALDLLLEDIGAEVVHIADLGELERSIEDVSVVILDAAQDLRDALAALKKKAPEIALVVLNTEEAPAGWPGAFFTNAPYSDREKIAAFVRSRLA